MTVHGRYMARLLDPARTPLIPATTDRLIPRLAILTAASFMATVGLFVRFMPLSVFGVVAFRGTFGFAWISLIVIATRNGPAIKGLVRHRRLCVELVASNTLTILFYFIAISMAGLGTAAFLLYLGNVISVAFMTTILKEPASRRVNVAYVLATAGVFLIVEPWHGFTITPGIGFGLLSALALAWLNATKKRIFLATAGAAARGAPGAAVPGRGTWMAMTWLVTLAMSIAFSFSWVVEWDNAVATGTILAGVLLGLVPTALAFTLFNVGLQRDKGGDILVLSYAEPFLAAVLQALVFQDLALPVVAGGSLVIAGNLLAARAGPPGRSS